MQDFPEFHSWQSYYKQAGVRAKWSVLGGGNLGGECVCGGGGGAGANLP